MWAAGSRGWGCAASGAFNVTPARYAVSKPGGPTFLSCGSLACCRSKKKICCPAEDRFVIVNCQWRSSEGALRGRPPLLRWSSGPAAAGCSALSARDRCSGQGTRSWEHPNVNRAGNRGCSLFLCRFSVTKSLAGDALSAGSAPHLVLLVPTKSHQLDHVLWGWMTPQSRLSNHPSSHSAMAYVPSMLCLCCIEIQ